MVDSGGHWQGWVLPALPRGSQDRGSAWHGPLEQAPALGAHLSLYLGSNVSCTTLRPPGEKGGREGGEGLGALDKQSFSPALWDRDGTEAESCFPEGPLTSTQSQPSVLRTQGGVRPALESR